MQAIVIDDSRAMRGILKRILTEIGLGVREACDGRDGLAKLAEGGRPDLALVDWNMPNMNGYEFVVEVRRDPAFRAMRIVMVTTEVEMHQMSKALDAGADEYVMKPFTPEAMREKLAMLGFGRGGGVSKIRVLVVDDAVVVRRIVSDVLAGDPQIEVVGTAANGKIALAKVTQVNPDLLTLDVEMPELDGPGMLRELRKNHPKLPVIMFSTLTARGAAATLDALAAGASDYVTKPANVGSVAAAMTRIREELIPKIKALCPRPPAPAARQFGLPAAAGNLPCGRRP